MHIQLNRFMYLIVVAAVVASCNMDHPSVGVSEQREMCFPQCDPDSDPYTIDTAEQDTLDWQQANYPGVPHENLCSFETSTLINCSVHVSTKMVRCWFYLNPDGSLKSVSCEIVG